MKTNVSSNIKSATVSFVIIDPDGTRKNMGVVASYHRNVFRRLLFALHCALRKGREWLLQKFSQMWGDKS